MFYRIQGYPGVSASTRHHWTAEIFTVKMIS